MNQLSFNGVIKEYKFDNFTVNNNVNTMAFMQRAEIKNEIVNYQEPSFIQWGNKK